MLFLAAFIALFTVSPQSVARQKTEHPFTVVIDAGHGGKDYGAIGSKAREKDVNLGVALRLSQLIRQYLTDVDVVMTRDNDTFVTLQDRAEIANRANGDLFISIHTNSVSEKSRNRNTVKGAAVYVLGSKSEENLAVAQRENSVIMLEDDYTSTYQGFDPNSPESYIAFELIQNQHMQHSLRAAQAIQNELVINAGRSDHGVRQAMFWVLVKTGMPAVLVELDFICNPTQERYLSSEAGQIQLAESIFNGLKVYKTAHDREKAQMRGDSPAPVARNTPSRPQKGSPAASPSAEQTAAANTGDEQPIIYKVQFLVSSRQLKPGSVEFKGIENPEYYHEGNTYKYTAGATQSMSDANLLLRQIKKKFPDAFIIKTRGGKRIK